jgi:hypothetical protein
MDGYASGIDRFHPINDTDLLGITIHRHGQNVFGRWECSTSLTTDKDEMDRTRFKIPVVVKVVFP